jgi:hypothetical protein
MITILETRLREKNRNESETSPGIRRNLVSRDRPMAAQSPEDGEISSFEGEDTVGGRFCGKASNSTKQQIFGDLLGFNSEEEKKDSRQFVNEEGFFRQASP